LRRHVDDVAVDVHLPAMIEAAQAAFFVAAERQRGATMRAMLVQDAHAPFGIAKGHQVFAQEAHAHRRAIALGDFLGQACGDPVTAHQLTHGRVTLDAA
jgi:hypothetical protein